MTTIILLTWWACGGFGCEQHMEVHQTISIGACIDHEPGLAIMTALDLDNLKKLAIAAAKSEDLGYRTSPDIDAFYRAITPQIVFALIKRAENHSSPTRKEARDDQMPEV